MNNPTTSEEEKRWIWLQLPVCSPVSCTEDNWCDLCEHTVSRLLAWKDQEVAKAKQEIWHSIIPARHNVGDKVGQYLILDRMGRIGKNTKFRVKCTYCNEVMFRFSNKFKLTHFDCPGKQAAQLTPTKEEEAK